MGSLFYFLDRNFWNRPSLVALFIASIFAILIVRYFVTAAFYQAFLKKIFGFCPSLKKDSQYRREVKWSVISSALFTLLAVATFFLYQRGYTRIYINLSDHSIGYFLFSIILVLFLYETYYYWLHRWMHRPSIFKIVHKVHHKSVHPTVFTSFSFHPIEAILQFIFLPIVLMIFPIHYYAIGIVLIIMTLSAVVNHAGIEIFPRNFTNHSFGKWLIGSTHHDLHHSDFRSNYGLYLTFWDKWMKTENENFKNQFEANKQKLSQSRSQRHQSTDDLRT